MASGKTKLSDDELRTLLEERPDWAVRDGMLVKGWEFKDFVEAMAFVQQVAALAEEAQHHPDISVRYNRVELGLVSHDAGGITARDARMVRLLSEAFGA